MSGGTEIRTAVCGTPAPSPSCPAINNPTVFCFLLNSPRRLVKLSHGPLVVFAHSKLAQALQGLPAARLGAVEMGGEGSSACLGEAEGLQGIQTDCHLQIWFEGPSPGGCQQLGAGSAHFMGYVGASLSPGFQHIQVQTPWRSGNSQEWEMWGDREQKEQTAPCVALSN